MSKFKPIIGVDNAGINHVEKIWRTRAFAPEVRKPEQHYTLYGVVKARVVFSQHPYGWENTTRALTTETIIDKD